MLKRRSLKASGDLDDYLALHARKEPERNHLEQFDNYERLVLQSAARERSHERSRTHWQGSARLGLWKRLAAFSPQLHILPLLLRTKRSVQ
ncbi:MAG: hypothetical protein JXX28_18300 [Deltaproteobacteria bacterium]|nr:hypothetical protein [Deltaproteobacteria bacterium]